MLKYTNLRWSSAEQLGTLATNTKLQAQLLKCYKHPNWFDLEKRRRRTRIFFLYKIIHHLVAIYPTKLLSQYDSRTRQYPHSYSYRLIQTTKIFYTYSLFSENNSTMEPPTCSCCTMYYTIQFPRADPNICSRTTFQHLSTTLAKTKEENNF